jgi:SagB-type dehydrogenase family enzyme
MEIQMALSASKPTATTTGSFPLPAPNLDGRCSVEKALAERKSVREFSDEPMSLVALSQLLWAAQGVTRKMDKPDWWTGTAWQGGMRTAPSAGALYPLEVYVVAGNVEGLNPGIYKYKPLTHELVKVSTGDKRSQMVTRPPGQNWLVQAPCLIVFGVVYAREEVKYAERAAQYVHIEVGHAVENLCLQAVALDLGSTVMGAFKDDLVKRVIGMPDEESPVAFVPVGKSKS